MEKGQEVLKDAKERMKVSLGKVAEDLSHIRAGRASVGLVDHIMVEAYDSRMPLRNVANITTPDATTILIAPYDKTAIVQDAENKFVLHLWEVNPEVTTKWPPGNAMRMTRAGG